ncbi:aromatic ring-hydroxylating dioxygenase subunit alpha [Paucibacter sp. PLA-PC-4]|uniref:aromatic ring-hydroxylating dioxygenase subunit alpha n=1 Tax=Paucibacter sp. PLA-PC-4 TaxID=2993655 RepID=UPI00224B4747|nr:aromatic ring-hydroxylating dioxygenase subunit alpha [Paucibacter sp. PLA-PC-4]MCX2865775.1 aromatic ring-hydroxylating dioxygenase subunit alpha [Paucibacter sp. PLA-PC-4]
MFPLNTWYVAARSEEIPTGRPLGRRICNQPMALFRSSAGQIAAVEDFCPHRGAPLSLGRVEGDTLVCGYHGLAMGCDGKTVAMPCQRVRGFPAIRSFPIHEEHGFVWVWPGDTAKADVAAIPKFEWLGNPAFAYGGGLYNIGCDYRLMIDNLMDLTHETYVHSTSIGQKEIDEVPCQTRVDGEQVITERFMTAIEAPPFWKMALRLNGLPDEQLVDRWQICRFTPPSHIMIEVGVALAGQGGYAAPEAVKAASWVVDFITPETDTSIHYFWGMARKFKPQDQALTDSIREGQGKIFAEDREMLERQQLNLLAWPERKLLMLNIDSGGVQSRKLIDHMLAAEAHT